MDDSLKAMLDERAINRLVLNYAEAVDRLNEPLLRRVFTADAVLEGPGWRFDGIDQICSIFPIMKDSFVSSWHATHHRHLQKGGYADNQVVTMIIRYRDTFVRTSDGWRISSRKEIVDWTETATIQSGHRE